MNVVMLTSTGTKTAVVRFFDVHEHIDLVEILTTYDELYINQFGLLQPLPNDAKAIQKYIKTKHKNISAFIRSLPEVDYRRNAIRIRAEFYETLDHSPSSTDIVVNCKNHQL